MYGWRKRIGLMVPSTNTVNEPEFYSFVPEGVSVHTARLLYENEGSDSAETIQELTDEIDRCTDLLTTANVDILVFACTTASMMAGADPETGIERRVSDAGGGIPAVSTAGSVLRALEVLAIDSLVVLTPYSASVGEEVVHFFERTGHDVVDHRSEEISTEQKGRIPSEQVYRDVTDCEYGDADGIFVSCTNFRTANVIEFLERDLDRPVVTSNQAMLWDTLRTVGIEYSDGPGRLFRQ
jgi:maleate cis-trans isomerase